MPRFRKKPIKVDAVRLHSRINIVTPEGTIVGNRGDWLITGVHGEQYPVKDGIFRETYEPVGAEAEHMWREVVSAP